MSILCRQKFGAQPGLAFQQADAQTLPFAKGTFDVVVNIESSHSYPSFERFVAEVYRVLKPGGTFCFADLRKPTPGVMCSERLRRQFTHARFTVARHQDITQNAALSIEERRQANGAPLWDEFESLRYLLRERHLEYHWFVLVKPEPVRPADLPA